MPAPACVPRSAGLDSIIRGEFNEMPGMRLTIPQVCRLWALSPAQAQAIVRSLVERGVLTFDYSGRVCRSDDLINH